MVKPGIFFLGLVVLVSCKVDPEIKLPSVLPSSNLVQVIPDGWPRPQYQFEENPITEDGFILGRALFYEVLLSKDNSVSCGSCHQQHVAFAHANHDLSHGIFGKRGTRNSPGLFNLNWHTSFLHDGGSIHIENQPLAPITNTLEMGEDINAVVAKLQNTKKYRNLFKNAFGEEIVNSQRLLKSLAQFMGLIYSYNSKYDYYKRNQNNVQLTVAELRGESLFMEKCNSCHTAPLFSDFAFRSNGLFEKNGLHDKGRELITSEPGDRYKFKTPSLRNIALTGPYMHDGRFKTLEACLDHYTNSSKNQVNLDPLLSVPVPLSETDKKDLIAFLQTLTDNELINDPRFADPNIK